MLGRLFICKPPRMGGEGKRGEGRGNLIKEGGIIPGDGFVNLIYSFFRCDKLMEIYSEAEKRIVL